MISWIKKLFNVRHYNGNISRHYTDEEKQFALEIYYAMGLEHTYWTDQDGINRFTDEALGRDHIPYNESLFLKYRQFMKKKVMALVYF
jgi:hypothetical protein